jgi:hypothetical protein
MGPASLPHQGAVRTARSCRFSAPSCARAASVFVSAFVSVFEIRITSGAGRLLSIARNLLASLLAGPLTRRRLTIDERAALHSRMLSTSAPWA